MHIDVSYLSLINGAAIKKMATCHERQAATAVGLDTGGGRFLHRFRVRGFAANGPHRRAQLREVTDRPAIGRGC